MWIRSKSEPQSALLGFTEFIHDFRLSRDQYVCLLSVKKTDLMRRDLSDWSYFRYLSDLVPHKKVTWFELEETLICAVQTVIKRSDMGQVWTKKVGFDALLSAVPALVNKFIPAVFCFSVCGLDTSSVQQLKLKGSCAKSTVIYERTPD